MAPSNLYAPDTSITPKIGPYTLTEALDYMDFLNSFPTSHRTSVNWVNARTGAPVVIGRTDRPY